MSAYNFYYLFWDMKNKNFVCIRSRTNIDAEQSLKISFPGSKFLFMSKEKIRLNFGMDFRLNVVGSAGQQLTLFDKAIS